MVIRDRHGQAPPVRLGTRQPRDLHYTMRKPLGSSGLLKDLVSTEILMIRFHARIIEGSHAGSI